VIGEVDAALRALILSETVAGSAVEVVFDAPTKDWAGRRNVPTIDVYLYDIREDLRRRERGMVNSYGDDGRVMARHLPPRHFKLSYLITAWTQRPEDEHRLLSALLACFLRHDSIPLELLDGPLAELGLPVPISIALPPPEDRSFADVWSALGGELKPSLDVVVCAPISAGRQYPAGPPVSEPILDAGGLGGPPPLERRTGRLRHAASELHRPEAFEAGHPKPTGPHRPTVHPPAEPRMSHRRWTDAFASPMAGGSRGPTASPDTPPPDTPPPDTPPPKRRRPRPPEKDQ
jgi:hypothetical protein